MPERNDMPELIIAPSVLSMDYSKMNEQLAALERSKASWIHFDVMDGHFVPNLSFGPDLLKGFKKGCNLFMDVHLMVDDPAYFAPVFAKAGADMVVFHTEALNNDLTRCHQLLTDIHALGIKAGFSVKPGTAIEPFEELLPESDMVLIMSVEPGYGGQSFMPDMLSKIEWLASKLPVVNPECRIEIDGGINAQTAKLARAAGCDTLVAGSYVFKDDIEKAVDSLC